MSGMEYFPHDLLESIFLRLPTRSLTPFKCLSKSWSCVFFNPKFTKNHLKTLTFVENHKDFLLQYHSLSSQVLSQLRINTALEGHEEITIAKNMVCPLETQDIIEGVSHCDGILCLFAYNYSQGHTAVVWNPRTQEHKRFPTITGSGHQEAFGFGYDFVADDYKVIYIEDYLISRIRLLQWRNIHSLRVKASSWNTARKNIPYRFTIAIKKKIATTVNGFLYWIAEKRDDSGMRICHVILCFDLETESLREETSLCGEGIFYEYQDGRYADLCNGVLTLLGNNSLCLARSYDGVYYELFKMEENKETKTKHWIKMMRILRDGLEEINNLNTVHPMCVTKNGQVLGNESSKTGVFLFNQDGSVKKIAIHGLLFPSTWFYAIPYIESLISPTA